MSHRHSDKFLPFFDHVCRHYGNILQSLPTDVFKELDSCVSWGKKHPLQWSLLTQRSLSVQWRDTILRHFQKHHKISAMALRVLELLVLHGRLGVLPDILAYLAQKTKAAQKVYIRVAKILSDTEVNRLATLLEKRFGRPVDLVQRLDSDLICGGILFWNTSMLDASLRRILTTFRNEKLYVLPSS